jgi:hypothetical protein
MRERLEQILKIVCLLLAALLAVQLSKLALHKDVLAGIAIPAVPNLASPTNASSAKAPSGNSPKQTNSVPSSLARSTNLGKGMPQTGTESAGILPASRDGTNIAKITNSIASGTNATANATNSLSSKSNSVPSQIAGRRGAGRPPGMPPGMRGGGPMGKPVELPPQIQARVDRIYQSELFGPVFHPVPMGLLGIAGNVAFLRAPNGQTGMVKQGDELGGVKLVRIGTNRVLVEQNGKQEELTVFNGFGGESLLPKTKENPQ